MAFIQRSKTFKPAALTKAPGSHSFPHIAELQSLIYPASPPPDL
jgi:hypothetical protein